MQTRSHGNHDLVQLDNHRPQRPRVRQLIEEIEAMGDQGIPHQQPPHNVGIGDTANVHNDRHGIQPPRIENNNFEVKTGLINMVQANRFYGLPSEDPLDHIDRFNKLLDLLKINGVSEDALKLRLFPFSLGDKAHIWETNLPQGSITTWESCKREFLNKFFSPVRTAKLRNEISSFKQFSHESFYDAWERFRSLTHQCPHHGFPKASLLSTIYRGALPKFRQLLDTASNGSFLAKNVDEAMQLVENLATSDGTYGEDYDRCSRSTPDFDEAKRDKEMKALNDKLDKQAALMDKQATLFDKLLSSTKKDSHHTLNYVDDFNYEEEANFSTEVVNDEEMNYVGNNGYNYNQKHPNLSYRSNNVANPQDQVYPPRGNQSNQVVQGNQGQQQRPQANFQATQSGAQQRPNQPPPGFQQNQRFGNQQGFRNQFNQGYATQPLQGYPTHVHQGFPQAQQPFHNQTAPPHYNQGAQHQAPQQPSQQGDLVTMMQQMLSGQSAITNRIVSMEDEIKHLKSQGASSSRQGQLPSKSEANPREYINAIELRSGTTLPPRENPHLNEDIEHKKGG